MISVVIPTLNEAQGIEPCLRSLLAQEGVGEVIVVDGGSADGTLEQLAAFPQVRLLHSLPGRGRQMNAGAWAACGRILLFLHADTSLPPEAMGLIEQALARPGVAAGSFYLRFDHGHPFLRLYSLGSRINHALFTYGDQGLFLSAEVFWRAGGFPAWNIMEDVEMRNRLSRLGRIVKVQRPVTTSARRYLRNGVIRQQALDTALVLLYHLGASPDFLQRAYR
ncbi:MAG: TIGR04283 family arsenosugar biosynthesis glycosyltransferase [Thermodesulfobacteriota bacterium]